MRTASVQNTDNCPSKTNFWNNLAIEEVDDALGVTGISLRVGDHHDGSALLVQLCQELHHFETILGVEVTSRLVGEDELGIHHDGSGNGDALLLTARELLREVTFSSTFSSSIRLKLWNTKPICPLRTFVR